MSYGCLIGGKSEGVTWIKRKHLSCAFLFQNIECKRFCSRSYNVHENALWGDYVAYKQMRLSVSRLLDAEQSMQSGVI